MNLVSSLPLNPLKGTLPVITVAWMRTSIIQKFKDSKIQEGCVQSAIALNRESFLPLNPLKGTLPVVTVTWMRTSDTSFDMDTGQLLPELRRDDISFPGCAALARGFSWYRKICCTLRKAHVQYTVLRRIFLNGHCIVHSDLQNISKESCVVHSDSPHISKESCVAHIDPPHIAGGSCVAHIGS
ncbi:MAG: hypothetical protein LBT76_04830, partial [Tannerella sp.]|nr:hypothetical protein [Tannerella sp.]